MLDAAIAFMWPDSAMDAALLDDDVVRTPTIGENYGATELKDGFVTVSAVSQPEFEGYLRALNGEHLLDDPRFATAALRTANVAAMREEIRKLTEAITVDEFLANSVVHDVPSSGINTLHNVHEEPQVVHNAPRFGGTPTSVPGHAPTQGEHSDEIVAALGLDPAAMRAAGAIF